MICHLICSTLVNTEGTFDSCNFRFLSFVQMHIFARKKKDPRQCYIMAFGWNLMPKMCNWNMALWRSSKFFRIMYCLRGVNRRTAHLCRVFKPSESLRSAKRIWKPSEWEVLLASHPQAALLQNRNQKTIYTHSKPPGWRLTNVRWRQALENCKRGETPLWCPEASIKHKILEVKSLSNNSFQPGAQKGEGNRLRKHSDFVSRLVLSSKFLDSFSAWGITEFHDETELRRSSLHQRYPNWVLVGFHGKGVSWSSKFMNQCFLY